MFQRGAAKKLVVYVGARRRRGGEPVYEAVVRFLHGHGCAGATVTRAVAGYGQSGRLHEAHLFSLSEDVPIRIEAVDSEEKIRALLPWVYEMVDEGLIEGQTRGAARSPGGRGGTGGGRGL